MKSQDTSRGFAFALSAYLIWGVVPVYFKLLSHVPPIAIVAQRIIWSIPLLLIIMGAIALFYVSKGTIKQHGTDTGRMCVAALNGKNIDHVCKSIAAVL